MKLNRVFSNYFRDKKVLVTGGSSGIGKEIAFAMLSHGADVTIVSNQLNSLQRTSEELKSKGLSANILQCNLAHGEEIESLVDRIITDYGVPNIIINNAGFAVYRTFEQSSLNEIEQLMQ